MDTKTVFDKRTIEAAFSCYRASLRVNGANRIETRSGSRKQDALRVASNRYHIPMGELKKLIRAMEDEQGILHNHPENYFLKLKYEREAADLEKQNNGVCPSCSDARDRWDLSPSDGVDEVKVRMNPFESEINGECKPMLSCLGCYLAIESEI